MATVIPILIAVPAARAQESATPPPPPANNGARVEQATTSTSFADQPLWTGLGINIGNLLTGVTAKMWATPKVAVQAAVGGGADGNDVRGHADLVFSPAQWPSPDGQYLLPLYLGVGGVLEHTFASGATVSSTAAGFRVPVGMSVLVRGNPVELFFEVAPELTVRNASSAAVGKYTIAADGAIGFRYYL